MTFSYFFDFWNKIIGEKSRKFAADMPFSRIIAFVLVLSVFIPAEFSTYAADRKADFTVAIDPGHGGRDAGCRSKRQKEKDIVLDVATQLQTLIAKNCKDSVKVVMTRDDDTFIPLMDRAKIANNAEADLFISIHVNSLDRRARNRASVHGASVYTVGLHKSEANLAVAMRENGVIELEEDFTATYQGFDPNSSESYIIFELDQNRNMAQSVEFAAMAQNQLIATAGRADKGVRQAGFLVLWATKMPSVLVELDFICNPEAETFLYSKKGRRKCAEALFEAFREYRSKHNQHIN